MDPEEGIDIDAVSSDLAEQLGGGSPPEEKVEGDETQQALPEGTSLDKPTKPAVAEPGTVAPGAEKPAATESRFDATKPPNTWSKEGQAAWATLPPPVQQEIAKREGDIAKFVKEQEPALAVAKGFEKVLAPYAEIYSKFNINPWQHLETLLGAHAMLVFGKPEQKVAMFKKLAQDAGIDLGKVASGDVNAESQNIAYIRQLEQRLAQVEQGLTGVNTEFQTSRASELEKGILEFAQDPAHPFFDEVAADIPRFIDSGLAKTLDKAYELAVLENPTTRAKFVEAERAVKQSAVEKAARDKAAKARKAMDGNVSGANTGRSASTMEGLDSFLHSQLSEIHSRNH